ncbi:hypothetical protein [Streptomyces sp. NPDC127105]|uniref:hypothetical protein n=1 Tax=Streptomyces sp. NPDC127105 TaxID=3345359 RepID=UPI00366A48B8
MQLRRFRWMACVLGAAVMFLFSACGSGATSPKELRRLAGSREAVGARERTEGRLRGVVRAYADRTELALGLVEVRDNCKGGAAKEWFFQDGDDAVKINCSVSVTAYYGADPHRMGDVLEGILSEGDHSQSLVPFGHGDYRRKLVSYYRGHESNPLGAQAPEPAELSDRGQTLSWDSVRDKSPGRVIGEPEEWLLPQDPPVSRYLREPEAATVAGIRGRYGMVFRLELHAGYYGMFKDEKTKNL